MIGFGELLVKHSIQFLCEFGHALSPKMILGQHHL